MMIPGVKVRDPFISFRRAYVKDVIIIMIQYMLYRGSLIPPYRINGMIAYKCANPERVRMFMIGMEGWDMARGCQILGGPAV